MKRYLMPIMVAILVLPFGLTGRCTYSTSSTQRAEALAFYQALYPISKELREVVDEWNRWNSQASQWEYELNLYSKSKYYETKLRTLSNQVATLYAPSGLRELKDKTVSAINKGIESFSIAQEYALTGGESYRLQAEAAQLEFNRLMGLAADEWDYGLARYKIKPSEVIPR